MPYNPSSAYPRHSTYTPPVYGRGFARGFNEIDWGARFGHANQMPGVDVGHALRAAIGAPRNESARNALEAQYRTGLISAGLAAGRGWAQERNQITRTRKIWNRAEYGDDPNEIAGPAGVPMARVDPTHLADINAGLGSTPRGRDPLLDSNPNPGDFGDPFASPGQTGGRPHVGGTNDRIGAIAQRVVTSSAMNQAVNQVLSGKIGGPMTVPKLVFKAGRAANRRRKGGSSSPAVPTQNLPF